ncbi:MAG: Fic family protein [Patescibacteria group bacterium]
MHNRNSNINELLFLNQGSFSYDLASISPLLKKTYFSLGKLDGMLKNQSYYELLLGPTTIIESVKSSNLESINSTILEQLEVEANSRKSFTSEQKLTHNYKIALLAGFEYIRTNQVFDLNLIKLIQGTLLPHQSKIRDTEPVVIANRATGEVLYKPPVGKKLISSYLHDWLNYANNYKQIDVLVKVSVLHAQFESIHPFIDGNGRTGRLLIILFLFYKKILSFPGLFISDYILRTRTYYYMALQEAQREGSFAHIIKYLITAIFEKSEHSQNLLENIQTLKTYFQREISTKLPQIYSKGLIDYLFVNPVYSISSLQTYMNINRNTASKYLHLLVENGFINHKNTRKNKVFYNSTFLKLLS